MKKTLILIPLLCLSSCASPPGDAGSANGGSGAFVRSDAVIPGKVAGSPRSCVSLRDIGENSTIGVNRILFETRGGLDFVNDTRTSCPRLARSLSLVAETPAGRLCDGDVVRVIDLQTGFGRGSCLLGPFTPYRPANRVR